MHRGVSLLIKMQPQVPPSKKFPEIKDPSPCKLSIAVQFWDPGSTFLLIFKYVIKILVFLILGDSKTKKLLFPALPLDFRQGSGMGRRRAPPLIYVPSQGFNGACNFTPTHRSSKGDTNLWVWRPLSYLTTTSFTLGSVDKASDLIVLFFNIKFFIFVKVCKMTKIY